MEHHQADNAEDGQNIIKLNLDQDILFPQPTSLLFWHIKVDYP